MCVCVCILVFIYVCAHVCLCSVCVFRCDCMCIFACLHKIMSYSQILKTCVCVWGGGGGLYFCTSTMLRAYRNICHLIICMLSYCTYHACMNCMFGLCIIFMSFYALFSCHFMHYFHVILCIYSFSNSVFQTIYKKKNVDRPSLALSCKYFEACYKKNVYFCRYTH